MMEDQPVLVSVVLNNHNYARFLGTAIDSALAQTHPDVEVIVVDDGSTDDSRAIIHSYGNRIIPLYQECRGQPSACNAGVARSRGDIIFLLDSDDVLEPTIVERVAAAFASDPSAAWVMFRLQVIDPEGRPTGVLKPPSYMPRRSGDLRSSVVAFPFDMVRMATSGNAFSASVLRRVLPIPEDVFVPSGVDWYLCPMVGLFGRTIFLDQVGGGYRLHGSNRNWYERPSLTIDLPAIRKELRFMHTTVSAIQRFATEQGFGHRRDILSVSYVASRLVSLKLDPAGHPIANDSVWRVWALGLEAVKRRFDVRWPMKVFFLGWFTLVSLAPGRWTRYLAELFYFPAKRGPLNQLLGVLHMPSRGHREAAA